jgi:hypothetical protein
MDRVEIELILNKDRTWLLETLAGMSSDELNRPATPSEHDPSLWWSMADHFVHLALIEHDFVRMIRRHLSGEANPVGLMQRDDGSQRSREELMQMVHAMTENWATKHRGKQFSELVAVTQKARSETLALLSELTDEQLLERLPGAPWSDGTIGGVLSVHGMHGRGHYKWATEGLAKQSAAAS